MRSGEITSLTWGQVDFIRRAIRVGRAKTSSGTGRVIPMNGDLVGVLGAHANWFTERFGEARPEHYLFPFGKVPCDPTSEAGVPESTMLALMGHMSRAMLERYSHIRMNAKRIAVEALSMTAKIPKSGEIPQESPKVSEALQVQ